MTSSSVRLASRSAARAFSTRSQNASFFSQASATGWPSTPTTTTSWRACRDSTEAKAARSTSKGGETRMGTGGSALTVARAVRGPSRGRSWSFGASRSSLGGPDRRGFLADFPATGGGDLAVAIAGIAGAGAGAVGLRGFAGRLAAAELLLALGLRLRVCLELGDHLGLGGGELLHL